MRTFTMIFKDADKLSHMIDLRRRGWTYESLALIYGVDHSSIYAWCKKMDIKRPKITISLDIAGLIHSLGITVPREKTYADYIKEQHDRRFPNLYKTKQLIQ